MTDENPPAPRSPGEDLHVPESEPTDTSAAVAQSAATGAVDAASAALDVVNSTVVQSAQAAAEAATVKSSGARASLVAMQARTSALPTVRGIEAIRSSGIVEVQRKLQAAYRVDLPAASGLANITDVLAKVSSASQGITATSWYQDYLERTRHLSGAMSVIDTSTFRGPHMAAMAATLTAANAHKGLLGGMTANAGVFDTLTKVLAKTQSAAATAHAVSMTAAVASGWREQMMSSIDTRELLLLKASAAAPQRRLLSARPLSAYDRYLDGLPLDDLLPGPAEEAREVFTATRTYGFGVDALVATDVLLSPLEADDVEEIIEVVRGEVIEPWEEARGSIAGDLRDRLQAIDPTIANLYVGAWDQFAARRPGHLESASHLANEVLSRVLRTLAPDADVRAWAAGANIPAKEIEHDGRVTRKARLRFIKREASRSERSLLVGEVDALTKAAEGLIGRLNAGKHDSVGTVMTLRTNLVTFEAVLLRILD